EAALLLLFLEDDLRQRDRGQVFLGLVVDDLDVVAVANHLADLVQRNVATVLGVIELAICVSLDDSRVRHLAPVTARSAARPLAKVSRTAPCAQRATLFVWAPSTSSR